MSEFLTFLEFGFRHIVDVNALDHVLFLVALAAIYQFRDARNVIWVVTAFTMGHSITLALAVTGALAMPTALIEFLIPVTIVLTGIENLIVAGSARSVVSPSAPRDVILSARNDVILSEANGYPPSRVLHVRPFHYRPILAGLFGLVHGAGFANYLKSLFVDDLAAPLLGFNVGIEIGQIAVLLGIAALFTTADSIIAWIRGPSVQWPALRLRVVGVSLLVVTVGTAWAAERAPW